MTLIAIGSPIDAPRRPRGAAQIRGWISAAAAGNPLVFGVALMLATTALWALAFAAPLAAPDATAVEIALGRFIAYGLLSVALLGPRLGRLSRRLWGRALRYALAGNLVYYTLLVVGIQTAGAALAVVVIGMLPVTVALAGGGSRGRLLGPLLLFGAGVLLMNAAKTGFFQDLSGLSPLGVGCLLASLAMWTWYAVDNARFLGARPEISAAEWSSVIGAASLGLALVGLPAAWATGLARDPFSLSLGAFWDLAFWSVALGVGATWLGTVLFNMAARRLETALLGQLIVFEALFGLFYVFAVTGRAPGPWEGLGLAMALLGVWASARALALRS